MDISPNHRHKLRFKIDTNAPVRFLKRWNAIKNNCENGNNAKIVEQMIEKCKLESTKKLPYLDRVEGGIGGHNNAINKQIRFRNAFMTVIDSKDNDIVMDCVYNTQIETWTYDELDDIMRAFIMTVTEMIQANYNYIESSIEMVNYNC